MLLSLFMGTVLANVADPTETSNTQQSPQDMRIERLTVVAAKLEDNLQIHEAIKAYARLFEFTHNFDYVTKQIELYQSIDETEPLHEMLLEVRPLLSTNDQATIDKLMAPMSTNHPYARSKSDLDVTDSALYLDRNQWKKRSLITIGVMGVTGGIILGSEAVSIRKTIHSSDSGCFYSSSTTSVCRKEAQSMLDREKQVALYADIGWLIGISSLGLQYYWGKQTTSYTGLSNLGDTE